MRTDKQKRQGSWITLSWLKDANPVQGNHIAFRKDYTVTDKPEKGTLCIAASKSYHLWINGVFVCDGPARSYPKEQIYDELDITSYLQQGKNTFAIIVQKPTGITGYSITNRMGLWMDGAIVCEHENIPLVSDISWKSRTADWFVDTPFLYTIPIGAQEHFNANLEPADWKISEPGEGWTDSFCLGGPGTPPWKSLHKSIISKNIRKPYVPYMIWKGSTTREVANEKAVNLVTLLEQREIKGSSIEPVKANGLIEANDENVFVFDFEKTSYASVGVDIEALKGNIRVELFYDLKFEGKPRSSTGFGSDFEGCCDSFTPNEYNKKWQNLVPRGFRFLTIRIVGEGQCDLRIFAEIIEYPYVSKSAFTSSDALLEKIWQISKATLLTATTDVIGEPVRENVLWTFDACVGGKAAYYSFGDTAMWRHGLELAALGIDEDGIPNAVVPAEYSFMILFDQTFYWVLSCKEYYMMTGDEAFARKMLPAIERLLGLCIKNITEDGFFIPPDYAWHWVDWALLNKEPYSMPINAMLLMAAQAANSLANFVGSASESATVIENILSRSLLQFYDEKEMAFRSRIPLEVPGTVNSINAMFASTAAVEFDLHSNALAYLTKLGTKEQRSHAVAKMLEILKAAPKNKYDNEAAFGIAWTQIILEPLFEEGYSKEGLEFIVQFYKPFIDIHSATWGESFEPNIYNTAHGWGACVNSLIIESICGIKPAEPGWGKVKVAPQITGDVSVQFTLETPKGEIKFTYENGQPDLKVPAGTGIL